MPEAKQAAMKHAMTGRNIYGQPRPGSGQLSVEQITENLRRIVLFDGFDRSNICAIGESWTDPFTYENTRAESRLRTWAVGVDNWRAPVISSGLSIASNQATEAVYETGRGAP